MADDDHQAAPASPPLPRRGAYNIDFDTLDESSNPFEPKVKLGSSPPRTASALPTASAADEIDPFKPRRNLSSSPPASPKVSKPPNNNNIGDDGRQASPGVDRSVSSPHSPDNLDDLQPASSIDGTQVTPKKKKIVKKTKIQSKVKAATSVKPPEEDASDSPAATGSVAPPTESVAPPPDNVAPPTESAAPPTENIAPPTGSISLLQDITRESVPLPKKPGLSRKKTKSNDSDKTCLKEEKPQAARALATHIADDDAPCEAASEAMVSSSEIDHQFVDNDDVDTPRPRKTRIRPAQKASDGGSDGTPDGRFSERKEDTRSLHSSDPALLPVTDVTDPATGSLTKRPSSPEATRTSRRAVNEPPVVTTPPQGKTSEGSRHPASRALEIAQADNSLQVLDSKNESGSEEALFYDAYDYPPAASTKAKLGQKPSAEMERASSQDDGGDSKGAVVQLVQVLRYSQSDWNKLKQDLELNFQASLLNKERDWSLMLAERDKKIAALEETNRKVKHTNEDMRMIVAEFEKTISQLQAEKEKTKTDSHKTVQSLESERDQAIEDLQSVETAFSDLHRRYEKSKSIIEGFKRNEEQLRQCVEDLQTKLKKSEMKLQALRSQAEDKLDKANEDIEKIKKSTRSDMVRLEAALKKAELRISGLEESLQRKEKENQELTAICDELIAKVGS